MNKELQTLSRILKKTGDKIIVVDEKGEPQFVMMDLKDYEKILENQAKVKDLTEEELLSKINRDISIWKNEQKESERESDARSIIEGFYPEEVLSKKNKEDRYYFEPMDDEVDEDRF
jgi:hypothetical protein